MSKIAVGMIIKDDAEVENLKRCLDSVAPHVDGIYLTVTQQPYDKIQELAKTYGVHLTVYPGEFNYTATGEEVAWLEKFLEYKPYLTEGDTLFLFDKARQKNLDGIPDEYDWFFWIDTDDVLLRGENLKLSADNALAQGVESLFYNYIYEAQLENGQIKHVLIQHLRERLVRINGDYRKVWKWIGHIHETLIQQRETKKVEDQSVEVLHLSNRDRMREAITRNVKMLEHTIYENKGKDPRPLYYLGKSHYDFHTPESYERSKKLILTYLSPEGHKENMSGWKEERGQAWAYLGEIFRAQGQINNSIKALMNSLIENPQDAAVYFSLGISYLMKDDPDIARFWAILGSKVPRSKTTLVSNPRDTESRAYEIIYNASLKTNRIDEAWAACEKLKELYPQDPHIESQWQFINQTREIRDQLKNFSQTMQYLIKTGQQDKLRALLASAPNQIQDNPYVVKMRQELMPQKDWTDKEIAIYCGPQFTQWDGTSLEGQSDSFVGGSEEAVIYLSRELAKLGYKIVVFGDPLKEGVYDGVEYLAHYKFNVRDTFNILIYWRAATWVDMGCKAKKTFIWTHDVLNPADYTKERLEKIDRIIVLSEAHRKNLPDIPQEKFLISSNGYFEHLPEVKPQNNPKWCLWTSSYDRGLENLLLIWPDVKKEVPEAELHIFYGWKLFAHFYKGNPERVAWMEKMKQLMDASGITHHDRVAQPEMERWYKKCGIWAYPSHFYEINCISAIKAQLWGAVPVTTNHAALKETVQYGKKVDGEIYENYLLAHGTQQEYKEALIGALKDEKWQEDERQQMMPWAREKYSWEKVAKQFQEMFGGEKNGK